MFSKFAAIIGLDSLDGKWSHLVKLPQEITTVSRRVRFVSAGESKSGADINSRKDIALNPFDKNRNSVHLDKITGVVVKEKRTVN